MHAGDLTLKGLTPARVRIKTSGTSLSTSEILKLQLAHAQARDAVNAHWSSDALETWLKGRGERVCQLETLAKNREQYLMRPDLGRKLDPMSVERLKRIGLEPGITVCVTDGLSPLAIDQHFIPFWEKFAPGFEKLTGQNHVIALMPFARVASSDEVGEVLGARVSLIFVGERPGLSAPDSLGVYFTYSPRLGRTDAERNCISNIRGKAGLSYEGAAAKLLYLLNESLTRGVSGVSLKDDWSPGLLTSGAAADEAPGSV